MNSSKGQYYKRKRHATVEPVLGVLTQFMGMRKVYTKGIHNANKQFIMAAIAYNLKKYLKFETKTVQPQCGKQQGLNNLVFCLFDHISGFLEAVRLQMARNPANLSLC